MDVREGLLSGFAAAKPESLASPAEDTLAARLLDAWHEATSAWPAVVVDPTVFSAALAARLDAEEAFDEGMTRVDAGELLLVVGCGAGDRHAIEALNTRYFSELRPAVARLGAGADVIDDVLSQVRARLLVGIDGEEPRIMQFRGQSSLRGWLKVIVVREAMATLRKAGNPRRDDEALEALMASNDATEFEHLRQRYREEFREAFKGALAELDAAQRTILRHSLLDRLSIDEIGALHGVHRSTAARWLARIRDQLYRDTRAKLLAQLEIDSAEFDGVMDLLRSQLDCSVGRHLLSTPK